MRHAGTKRMFEYWNRLRAGRAAPAREEIEPSDIRHDLGDTFILNVSVRPRSIAYRLAGTRLCAAYGRELKGYGFLCNFTEDNGVSISNALTEVHDSFQPQILDILAQTATGKEINYEMLLLPLLPMADGSMRILGISTPSETPYWLGEEALIVNQLIDARTVDGDEARSAHSPIGKEHFAQAPGLSDDIDLDIDPGIRRVKHLVVHEGGKSET